MAMTSTKLLILCTACALFAACGESPAPADETASPAPSPADIAATSIIVDTHIDVPYRMIKQPEDVSEATEFGQFDYPRAVAGGLNAAFMSIYTPASYAEEPGKSWDFANGLIDMVEGFVADAPDKFAIATSVDEVRRHFEAGLISLPLGMENGSPIEGELARLDHFYERGIRYITLCHSLSNRIADSSYDDNKRWQGLSEFGVDVVRRMNELGIMVDVSHISDDAFRDVMANTAVPVIASHSSARHFTPGWERNMSDEMIRQLADNGGVIMINFGSAFLSDAARRYSSDRSDALATYREANPRLDDEALETTFTEEYEATHGSYPYATLDDVLDHIDHVVELTGGVEHVGLGSDYDGVGDSLPTGLKDVSDFPNLVGGLRERGYTDDEIRQILGENLLRVWSEVEAYAARQRS